MARRKKARYVDNCELYTELERFYMCGTMCQELHMMFWKMANHIINMARFNRYSIEWKEDMISSAYVKCVTIVNDMKYDMDRTNPFSYFTTVVRNCFLDFCVVEKKQKRIKQRVGVMMGIQHAPDAESLECEVSNEQC